MISRAPGRYNLHRLGWAAFEDLCMQVMRVVLGETCTRFRPGRDAGRDGWFQGIAAKTFLNGEGKPGAFVLQCKHTSLQTSSLAPKQFAADLAKVASLPKKPRFHYVLMTNRQVTAETEAAIRGAVEALPGVERCHLLAETWVEDTIDAHPRLLRLVPRLYGIGDLSQIQSFVIEQQSRALLEDLAVPLRTFIPTTSYRAAEKALHEHGFVVLVGPPASGKTAIAASLCMAHLVRGAEARVLRIEHAAQFGSTWSPADSETLYWVDDVFGETTLDDDRMRDWSAALEKVEAARKRGSSIIFCTRDYILAAAQEKLKRTKVEIINDARVRVDVTNLSADEKDSILYSHIKDGNLPKATKSVLRQFLPRLARLASFSPELARRLGNARFHNDLKYQDPDLRRFFDKPVHHFRDVIHGLSDAETAALAVCLLANNEVPDPVPDDALTDAVLRAYAVSAPEIRSAFESLEGSLVKRVRHATAQTWQVHHPSMIEALQAELAGKSSKLLFYLESARLNAILRDTTTAIESPSGRLVFVAQLAYPALIERFRRANAHEQEGVARYLIDRASDEFVHALDGAVPALIDASLQVEALPDQGDIAARVALRLNKGKAQSALGVGRRHLLEETIKQSMSDFGWMGFLDVDGFTQAFPDLVRRAVGSEAEARFPSVAKLAGWYAEDLSSIDHIDGAIDGLSQHHTRLLRALRELPSVEPGAEEDLAVKIGGRLGDLEERRAEVEEDMERRAEIAADEWRDTGQRDVSALDRYADVDE